MLRALGFLLAMVQRHAGLLGTHTKARAMHVAVLALFALTGFVFLLILVTVILIELVGPLPGLAIMAGGSLVICLFVLLLMRREQRRHELAIAAQKQEESRMMQTAILAALPALRASGLLATALGAAALVFFAGRGRRASSD